MCCLQGGIFADRDVHRAEFEHTGKAKGTFTVCLNTLCLRDKLSTPPCTASAHICCSFMFVYGHEVHFDGCQMSSRWQQ